MKYTKFAVILACILSAVGLVGQATAPPAAVSREAGRFYAPLYAFGINPITPPLRLSAGNSATGTQTVSLNHGAIALSDGRVIYPLQVGNTVTIDPAGTGANASENVLITASSGCTSPVDFALNCQITGSFANVHNTGASVTSSTAGLQEAIQDAQLTAGGLITVDQYWSSLGGTDAIIAAALPYANVAIEDETGPDAEFWNVTQGASTLLAVPTVLSASTAVPSTTPAGSYGTGTYFMCIAYVDIAGQEGACSTTFSQAGLSSGSFVFSAPAASTGAVGYTIYISLTGGTYSLAYQVPLTSTVCRLTALETVTPACAVTNATYGQTGATASVTAITVNTSPVDMQLGGISGTFLTGNPGGRTIYVYAPGNHLSSSGIPTISLPFTAGGIGSAAAISIGTVNLPAGLFNHVGTSFRVCGKFINTDVNSIAQALQIYWDAPGSNVAGSPVKIGNMSAVAGPGTAATYTGNFCETFHTSVSGAGATAGSIFPDFSLFNYYLSSAPGINMLGGEIGTAAVGSLNLAGTAGFSNRLSIVHTNTTGNNTPTLQNLTIELL